MSAPYFPFGPSLLGAWVAMEPGVYAIVVMAKLAPTNASAAPGLLAPTFYVRVGPALDD